MDRRPGSGDCLPLGHLMLQTKRWNEAIRMTDPKRAVAIAHHHHAGSVRADDIKATGFLRPDGRARSVRIFWVGRGGDPSPDSCRYRYAALRAFSPHLPKPAPVAATVPLGAWCSKQSGGTKRFVMTDLSVQSPSLTMIHAGSVRADDIKATGF